MGLFDLFKGKNRLKEYLQNGAIIIDVRTPQEFRAGHVKGAKNIPLQDLNRRTPEIKKNKPVVLCCASGMRSGQAKAILKGMGIDCINGGSWTKVNNTMK